MGFLLSGRLSNAYDVNTWELSALTRYVTDQIHQAIPELILTGLEIGSR